MKPEIFWLFRNDAGYRKSSKKPRIVYKKNGTPVWFNTTYYDTHACQSQYDRIAPSDFHLREYQAKKWRVTTDKNGDVHFELLEWIWIDRKS